MSNRTRGKGDVKTEALFVNAARACTEEPEGSSRSILVGQPAPWVPLAQTQGRALATKSASPETPSHRADPSNHAEAMADDPIGWAEAEATELKNHEVNGSFTVIDRRDFERDAPGRRLVKLVWVYKRKRSGRMKARLCVQGCSQQPGVDFDQTHCATMRGTSLRLLSSIAGQHGLKMMSRSLHFG